jgi:putative protease
MKTPEILAPAGSMEALETACLYGADAVYLGLKEGFSLREGAKNFSLEDLKTAVGFAHSQGVKVYLTLNTYPHDAELKTLPAVIQYAQGLGIDAFIISDIGVLNLAKTIAPEIPIHVSTQANTTNSLAVAAWADLGAKRIVLARELSYEEIAQIRKYAETELEIFVHGSVCISMSGRCLISNYLCERDANRGACTQPCRWEYSLVERTRPGEPMPIHEQDGFTFLYNSKDLCLMPVIDKVFSLGLNSLKIEGRGKTILYVATTVAAYKKARDAWQNDPEKFSVDPEWMEELKKITNRGYFQGGFCKETGSSSINYDFKGYNQTHHLAARILEARDGSIICEARNPLIEGMELEWLSSNSSRQTFVLRDAVADGKKITHIKPNQQFSIKTSFSARPGELIRKTFSQGDKVVLHEDS